MRKIIFALIFPAEHVDSISFGCGTIVQNAAVLMARDFMRAMQSTRQSGPGPFSHSDNELKIVWSDDTKSAYSLEFLTAWAYDRPSEQTDRVILWNKEIGDRIQRHDYREVCGDAAALKSWLLDVQRYGFSLLKNVPPVEETIFDVVGLFGYVRETNYGRLFEIRAEENANNLAYTPVPLSVHTDNPYRDPCPTLQLLHCLVQADQGGITAVADGFYAADKLRREAPEAFTLLSESDVSFQYEGDGTILDNTDRIIILDTSGKPRKIRINNRAMAPLSLHFDLVLPFLSGIIQISTYSRKRGSAIPLSGAERRLVAARYRASVAWAHRPQRWRTSPAGLLCRSRRFAQHVESAQKKRSLR